MSEPVPMHCAVTVAAGQQLVMGKVLRGCRWYLAIRGGLDLPVYLGSHVPRLPWDSLVAMPVVRYGAGMCCH